MNKRKNILLIVDFVLMLVFVVLDQFTKYLAVYYLRSEEHTSELQSP